MTSLIRHTLAAGLFCAATTLSAHADVTLINVFNVPEGQVEETIEAWEVARDYLSQQPGYIETALHRSLHDDERFQLINIASWRSEADFLAATTKMRELKVMPRIDGLEFDAALYSVVRQDKKKCGRFGR